MPNSEDYGFVVGIDDYKKEPYSRLEGARLDAKEFYKWLRDPRGGDVPKENIRPFARLSDRSGRMPTFTDLSVLLMQELRARAPEKKKRIGRRLYLFLAGHGVNPKGEFDDAGLITVEAGGNYPIYLPSKQSADDLCFSVRFEEVLLFMDCCRVPDLLLAPFRIPNDEKPDSGAHKVKRFYAFATGFGQLARERSHEGVVRGIFSRILLDGLKGAAPPDSLGRLTTTQLSAYLRTEMNKIVIAGEPLSPKILAPDEIVIVEGVPPKLTAVHLTLSQRNADIEVLDGGNNFAIVEPRELTQTSNGIRFSLPYGRSYAVRAPSLGRTELIRADQEEVHVTL